jgi:hypothetical protein
MLPGHGAAPDGHLRAVRPEDVGLLLSRAVGYDDLLLVAALPADNGQAGPDVASTMVPPGRRGAVALGRLGPNRQEAVRPTVEAVERSAGMVLGHATRLGNFLYCR